MNKVRVPSTVDGAVQQFLLSCQANGLADSTVKWYRHILNCLAVRFWSLKVTDISIQDLRRYIVELRSRKSRYVKSPQRHSISGGLSDDFVSGHLRGLRRFFNWCSREYGLDHNPMWGFRIPSHSSNGPKAIDPADLRKLFEATEDNTAGIRDRAMLAFMADTGCRSNGLLTLTIDRLDINRSYAIVTEKGRRLRAVPFTPFTGDLLSQWLVVRPQIAITVFCALGGKCYGNPLTNSGLHQILRRLAKRAGVKGRINPHSFRHGFAREYLQNGGDLATLARILGHSSTLVTTQFYAIFTDNEVAAMHAKFSPMVNWEKNTASEAVTSDADSRSHR